MATCVESKLEFGHELDTNTGERELSRTDRFVSNFLTNEIWRTNELSPFIAKIVTKIKSTDECLREPRSEESIHCTRYEPSNWEFKTKNFKTKLTNQHVGAQESSGLIDWDPILQTALPPYEHLTETDDEICNALYEDGKQEGSVWKDNVIRYNNPFDPRLQFDGLLTDKLREQCETRLDECPPNDTYNCYLDILNASGFTNSYLKYYRQCQDEFRREKLKTKHNTWTEARLADQHGNPTSHTDDLEPEVPDYVGDNSEYVDLWATIEPTQVFWTREDYKWLDNVKFDNNMENFSPVTSVPDSTMNKSVQYNDPVLLHSAGLHTDMASDTDRPRDEVLHWTPRAPIAEQGEINAHTSHGYVAMHGHEPQHCQQHTYQGQQANTLATSDVIPDCSNFRVGQTYGHTDTQPTSGTWSNGETGDYTALKNSHKEHRTNQRRHAKVQQQPVCYYPVVPELTTSMFWSHQKREYQNKQNASSQNVWQDVPPPTTVVSDECVPIPYERNGQRCNEFSSYSHQPVELINNQDDQQRTNTAKSYQDEVFVNNGYAHAQTSEYLPQYGYEQRNMVDGFLGANGYHSYPQSTIDSHRSSNGKHRVNGANRGMTTNHFNDAQKTGGYTFGEVVDLPVQGNQLINVNAVNSARQDLKFDDEVWYINGVPHQHAKPLCLQTSNLQYAADVAPDGWSQTQEWSTSPVHDGPTNFTECLPTNTALGPLLSHSQTEYNNSAYVQPPTNTMHHTRTASKLYACNKNSVNFNGYQNNMNNNSSINEMVYKSTDSFVPKLTANSNKYPDVVLSPTSSLSSCSTQSSSNTEYRSESAKESSTSDTSVPVSWYEHSYARKHRDKKVKYVKSKKMISSAETLDYDSCDSTDSNPTTITNRIISSRNSSRKAKRAPNIPGKQIKVLSGNRTTASVQNKTRHRNTRTKTKSCLIKIV